MQSRVFFLYFILLISFLLLLARLFLLQIIKGSDLLTISSENRIRIEKIPAARGVIYDDSGEALVRNVPMYKLKTKNEKLKTISKEEALMLELEGEKVEMGLAREYPYDEILASVLGYVDSEMVGRAGIEAVYDEILTGEDGGRLLEVDSQGKVLHQLGEKEPVSGEDVHLSLNLALQKKAFELLKDKKGAVVVSGPDDGQILALVSSPSYDPNLFSQGKASSTPEVFLGAEGANSSTSGVSDSAVEKLLNDPDQPLFNRAIAGLYPPGSVFKMVTAVAGLEEGKIDSKTLIEDTGEIRIGPYRYGNWYFDQYGKKEGILDIVGAIRRSNDIFFYKVGEYVGANKLVAWARRFGLSRLTEIDLLAEAEGEVIDADEKEKRTGERWFLGNTYHLSIGQGYLMVTPLQVNVMTNVIANGGKLCQPKVADFSKEEVIANFSSRSKCADLGLKQETIVLIKKGMKQACQPGGTAFPFFDFEPQVACKTGTAEFGPPAGGEERTHAWFTVFAPVEEPQISVTVLLEAGGEGSRDAAPIAKEILEEWFIK